MTLWLFLSILLTQNPIPQVGGGTVSGTVRLPDGKPAVGVRVAAMVPPAPGLNPGTASELAALGKTDDSGRYRLEDVPAGRYYIVAGRVVIDANSPDKKLPAWLTLNARDDATIVRREGTTVVTNSGSYSLRSSVAADGTFSVSLPPGESTIFVQGLPEGYTVKSITSGSTDLLRRPVDVRMGMPEIVIVLTADLRPRFIVSGRVADRTSRSMMGEQIELLGDSGLISRIILDAQGEFAFRRLLPGNYILRLASILNVPEQRITVTDHDVTSAEFTLSEPRSRQ